MSFARCGGGRRKRAWRAVAVAPFPPLALFSSPPPRSEPRATSHEAQPAATAIDVRVAAPQGVTRVTRRAFVSLTPRDGELNFDAATVYTLTRWSLGGGVIAALCGVGGGAFWGRRGGGGGAQAHALAAPERRPSSARAALRCPSGVRAASAGVAAVLGGGVAARLGVPLEVVPLLATRGVWCVAAGFPRPSPSRVGLGR